MALSCRWTPPPNCGVPEFKPCARCLWVLPVSLFRKNSKMRSGLSSWCDPCFFDRTRIWRLDNRSWLLGHRRELYLARLEDERVRARQRYRQRHPDRPREAVCPVCGEPFVTRQPAQKYFPKECAEIARRQRRPDRQRLPKPARQKILHRDGWHCYLCDKPIPRDVLWPHPMYGTVDHVKPVSAGGSDDPSNLRAAHWHCNEEKGDRLLGIEMGFSLEAA